MSLVSALLALTMPAASVDASSSIQRAAVITFGVRVPAVRQVRIEQRITVRIAPRRAATPPELSLSVPRRSGPPRMTERRMGKCVPVSAIAGVQVSPGNRLVLFLRDNRLVSAGLERSCRARDFYSGFYLERHADGKLCVDRDTLLSRSGTNCKLAHIRELVPDD